MFVVKKNLSLVVVILLCGVLSSCSWIRKSTGEDEPIGLSPTGLGAATGAVVGSGIGAIIGSQSGNAGIGVAIGGLSGAALGGALGQQEGRELSSKEERNIRSVKQEELLKANQNRINEFKRGSDFANERRGSLASPSSFSRSSAKSSLRNSTRSSFINTPSGYRGSPRAVRFDDGDFDTKPEVVAPKKLVARNVVPPRVDEVSLAKSKVVPARGSLTPTENPSSSKIISKTSQVDLIPEVTSDKVAEEVTTASVVKDNQLPGAKGLEPAVKVADDSIKSEISKATVHSNNGIIGVPVQPDKVIADPGTEEIKTTVITGSKVVKPSSEDDCSRADLEYQRATTSISDADKLFYLRRALRLCSAKPNLHLATGRVYSKLGRVEDAEYEFRQVLDLEPSNAEAAKELANVKQGIR